jgi:hypothetical protein
MVGIVGYFVGGMLYRLVMALPDGPGGVSTPMISLAGMAGAVVALRLLDSGSASSATPRTATQRRSNYLVRHWRGELSIGVSYWVNGFILHLIVSGEVSIFNRWANRIESHYAPVLLMIASSASGLLGSVWHWVGTWRAAKKATAEKAGSSWAGLAQGGVIVAGLIWVGFFATRALPAMRSAVEQARWIDQNAKWNVRALRDGAELEISGGIGAGFARDLERVLDANKSARILHVNLGMGGLVAEAKTAREAIRTRGLDTYVSVSCASACTLVFMGGKRRILKNGARLGFHTPTFPGALALDWLDRRRLTDAERNYLTSAGVSETFASRVMSTPPESIWYPTLEELLEAGVVTESTDGMAFAASSGASPPTHGQVEDMLDRSALYRAMKAKDPSAHDEVVRAVHSHLARGDTMAQIRNDMRAMIMPLVKKALPDASDAALLRLAALQVREFNETAQVAPGLCGRDGVAPANLSPDTLRADDDVSAEALASAVPGHATLSVPRARMLLRQAVRDARSAMASATDPAASCRNEAAFYAAILRLPPPDGAALLRFMIARPTELRSPVRRHVSARAAGHNDLPPGPSPEPPPEYRLQLRSSFPR